MDIIKVFEEKKRDPLHKKIPTIAFLGDSVTQGCFDVYVKKNGSVETYFDKSAAYHTYVAKILEVLYPDVPVTMINAGISGGNAVHGFERLERDVLSYHPDLTVVCFGLNDCTGGVEGLDKYVDALRKIFRELKAHGSEVIFMTPNMMNTEVSCHIQEAAIKEIADNTAKTQNDGILDAYVEAAKQTAKTCGAALCDVYEKWKILSMAGVDTTDLLANHINHPTKEMNWLFAYSLVETFFSA